MSNQTTFDLDNEIENELENENEGINSMIFDKPITDPQKAFRDFFIAWRWPEAKAQLWKMCKASACSVEYDTTQDREMLFAFTETLFACSRQYILSMVNWRLELSLFKK